MSKFTELDVDVLKFDRDNPRLPSDVKGTDEHAILNYLATRTGIEHLMTSIGENGFFPGEAIVVTPDGIDAYTVLEGNRRLAAIRLLNEPDLLTTPRIRQAAKAARHIPRTVPAYVVDNRDEALQYLGFRHISGVQRWEPLAKARYLRLLFASAEGDPQKRYTQIAREIGSTNPTVRRNLDALAVYEVLEQNDFFEITDISEESFQFGTFYTAISNGDIASFVGIREEGQPGHPIANEQIIDRERVEELVRLMFQRDALGDTKLGESRNIGKLGAVLANRASLLAIRSGLSLETAYRLSPRGRDDFLRHMNQAIEELKQANATLHAVDRDDEQARKAVKEALSAVGLAAERLRIV